MGPRQGFAAGLAAVSMLTVAPGAQAAAEGRIAAEMVQKLDIMLMVSSLRCRNTSDNFQADYADFSASHLAELNQASDTLKADLTRSVGDAGAQRALDKLSTSMANQYGQGHPWLDCHDLKLVTRELADDRRPGVLLSAADDLLDNHGNGRASLEARY